MSDAAEDGFTRTSSNFMTWLAQRPGTNICPNIALTDLRSRAAGRGVVAIDDIEEGEELFALQLADVLSVDTSVLRMLLPQELQDLDEWLSLVLVLIYEYGQGEKSAWRHYLDILPTQFDTLAFWTPQELEELQGSAVLKKIGTREADKAFKTQLLPIVKAHPDVFGVYAYAFNGPDAESVLLGLAHRMATLVMAYAFDLEAEQFGAGSEETDSQDYSLPKGMVPLADLLNADGERNNAHLIQQAASMHMIALKPIKKGEEIYNDYGQLPRSDLLRRYGYITDSYRRWDVVEIDSKLIIRKACEHPKLDGVGKQARSKLAKNWEVDDDAFDVTREAATQTFDPVLLSLIDVYTMDATTLKEEIEANEAPEEPRFTLDAAHLLRQVLIDRRNDYKSTIAEDVALLQDKGLTKRLRMAVEVRLGEKEIIAAAVDSLQHQIEDMHGRKETTNGSQISPHDVNNNVSSKKRKKV